MLPAKTGAASVFSTDGSSLLGCPRARELLPCEASLHRATLSGPNGYSWVFQAVSDARGPPHVLNRKQNNSERRPFSLLREMPKAPVSRSRFGLRAALCGAVENQKINTGDVAEERARAGAVQASVVGQTHRFRGFGAFFSSGLGW